jgi:hypothetical protein
MCGDGFVCGAAFRDLISAMALGDVTDITCDLLSLATPVVLRKKTEKEMEALKLRQGLLYKQPHRLLGMGSTMPKNCGELRPCEGSAINCCLCRSTLVRSKCQGRMRHDSVDPLDHHGGGA